MRHLWRRISKNVRLLGFVSFFNDIASEMLYPIIPIFLTAVLGAPAFIVGLIEGVAEAAANILKFFTGLWSDRLRRRKRFLVIGYGSAAFAKLLLSTAYSWVIVLLARLTDRFGKGIRTAPRDALIADSSQKRFLGVSFGFHRALDTAGAVVGPLLALLFITIFKENYRLLFLFAVIPSVIGLFLLIPVKELRPKKAKTTVDFRQFATLGKELKFFLLISFIFALGNSSDVFIILKAKSIGFSLAMVIIFYASFNLVYAIFSTPAGAFADKMGKGLTITIGFFLFALVYLGFAYATASIWVMFAFYGLYMALTEGVGKAYISELAPKELRGTVLGIFAGLTGIATLLASVTAGLLWSYVAPQAAFFLGSTMALIAGLLMIYLLIRHKHRDTKPSAEV